MKRWILFLSVIFGIIYLPFLDKIPLVSMDEPAYAHTAYMFATGKGLVSTIWVGSGQEFFLYPFLLSFFYKIAGCSLWSIRFFSLCCGILACVGLVKLCKGLSFSFRYTVCAVLLFISSNTYFIIFRSGRPESLVTALVIWSQVHWIKWREEKSFLPLFCAALLAALATLAHPIGGFWLLWVLGAEIFVKDTPIVKRIGIIGSACSLVGLLWVMIYTQSHSLGHFLSALSNRSTLGLTLSDVGLSNLKRLYLGYSLGLKRLFIVLFEVGILGISSVCGPSYCKRLARYALFFLVASVLLLYPFLVRYMALVPYICIVCALGIINTLTSKSLKRILVACLIIYGSMQTAGNVYMVVRQLKNPSYKDIQSWVASKTTPQSVYLVPIQLWFTVKDSPVYCDTDPLQNLREKDILLAFLNRGSVNTIMVWEAFLDDTSPTTGLRQTLYANPNRIFFDTCLAFANDNHWSVSWLDTSKGRIYCLKAGVALPK
jgi:hypothetical protein